jgi:hypothetical protein
MLSRTYIHVVCFVVLWIGRWPLCWVALRDQNSPRTHTKAPLLWFRSCSYSYHSPVGTATSRKFHEINTITIACSLWPQQHELCKDDSEQQAVRRVKRPYGPWTPSLHCTSILFHPSLYGKQSLMRTWVTYLLAFTASAFCTLASLCLPTCLLHYPDSCLHTTAITQKYNTANNPRPCLWQDCLHSTYGWDLAVYTSAKYHTDILPDTTFVVQLYRVDSLYRGQTKGRRGKNRYDLFTCLLIYVYVLTIERLL